MIAPGCAAASGDLVHALDRVCGDLFRRHIYSGSLGSNGAILRCRNDIAATSKITNDLGVIGRIDDGSCLGGETSEVLRNCEVPDLKISWQKSFDRDGTDELASADQLSAYPENLSIDGFEEVFRVDQGIDCGKCLVVDEDRAEQTLLSLDVVRQGAAENVIDCSGVLVNVHGDIS